VKFFHSSQFKEDSNDVRLKQSIENDLIDNKYGFIRVKDYQEHTGYLINMHSVIITKNMLYNWKKKVFTNIFYRPKLLMKINV